MISLHDIDIPPIEADVKQTIEALKEHVLGLMQHYTDFSTSINFFDLNLPKVSLPRVSSLVMKIKIVVGSMQCFAYFPVTFDIPWPENLLSFMRVMEFLALDLYAILGDVSCKIQTGFLQKYGYPNAHVGHKS